MLHKLGAPQLPSAVGAGKQTGWESGGKYPPGQVPEDGAQEPAAFSCLPPPHSPKYPSGMSP